MGKLTPAHRARAPTARVQWVSPQAVGESQIPIATAGGPPTAQGQYKVPQRWVDLHGGQGSISLEYQIYTSAYLFDTLLNGLPPPAPI